MTRKDLIGALAGLPNDAVVSIRKNTDFEDDEVAFVECVERRYPNKVESEYEIYICNGRRDKFEVRD